MNWPTRVVGEHVPEGVSMSVLTRVAGTFLAAAVVVGALSVVSNSPESGPEVIPQPSPSVAISASGYRGHQIVLKAELTAQPQSKVHTTWYIAGPRQGGDFWRSPYDPLTWQSRPLRYNGISRVNLRVWAFNDAAVIQVICEIYHYRPGENPAVVKRPEIRLTSPGMIGRAAEIECDINF